MLCSAQTGKSGSNWLDRLRSNKGIPTGDDPDLDSFLLTAHSQSPQARPTIPPRNPPSEARDQPKPMSTILAELFMGATFTKTYKKCPRKQTNPKIFLPSSAARNVASAAPSSDAAVPEAEEETAADRGDEDEGNELKGFTKSEVTVIDTSCPGWKVDKFVFRKNSVWKVRERKPKNKFLAKRKSNPTLAPCDVDLNSIETSNMTMIPLTTYILLLVDTTTSHPEGQCNQHERREACKDTKSDLKPYPKKRQVSFNLKFEVGCSKLMQASPLCNLTVALLPYVAFLSVTLAITLAIYLPSKDHIVVKET
ncbi:hypothetical protein CR513_23311, partial [Mucuna pruriens]